MSSPNFTILLVDDDASVLSALYDLFSEQYECLTAASGIEAIQHVKEHPGIATVVLDIKMAGLDGLATFREIKQIAPQLPVIFHTGYPGEYDEGQIDVMLQPFDYIQKGKSITRLERSVRNGCEASLLRQNEPGLVEQAEAEFGLVGRSKSMQQIYRVIRKVGPSELKVLVLGETGTGKELVARALHACSLRSEKPFIPMECNHKNAELVGSELFGHRKGSFTGATDNRIGLFKYADGGTLFLDEIGDLDITTQARVLRVIERGEFLPIGSDELQRTDVRIICATNKDLAAMVKNGMFREDLYYRLKEFEITLPPLRERREDIPLLVDRFCRWLCLEEEYPSREFTPPAMRLLIEHEWRGNVRELLNVVKRLVWMSETAEISADDVRLILCGNAVPSSEAGTGSFSERVKEFKRTLIIQALTGNDWNVAGAARELGMDRANLRKAMDLLDISRE